MKKDPPYPFKRTPLAYVGYRSTVERSTVEVTVVSIVLEAPIPNMSLGDKTSLHVISIYSDSSPYIVTITITITTTITITITIIITITITITITLTITPGCSRRRRARWSELWKGPPYPAGYDHIYTYIYIYIYMFMYRYMYMHVYVYIYIYICLLAYDSACIWLCMHMTLRRTTLIAYDQSPY